MERGKHTHSHTHTHKQAQTFTDTQTHIVQTSSVQGSQSEMSTVGEKCLLFLITLLSSFFSQLSIYSVSLFLFCSLYPLTMFTFSCLFISIYFVFSFFVFSLPLSSCTIFLSPLCLTFSFTALAYHIFSPCPPLCVFALFLSAWLQIRMSSLDV